MLVPTSAAPYAEPDLAALENLALPCDDDTPMENTWHRLQINLLDDVIHQHWRGRTDFYVGGNMFVYYSLEQVKTKDYKGPDLFVVKDVDGSYPRPCWVAWQEGGRLPDFIVELLSESTMDEDLGRKKQLYERVFRTLEYVCYGPDPTQGTEPMLRAWKLVNGRYEEVLPDARGWIWSTQLEAWLGIWEGSYAGVRTRWLRLFDAQGQLVPTAAEAEHQRAEAERQRAEAAEQRAALERERAEAAKRRAEEAERKLAELQAELARLRAQRSE